MKVLLADDHPLCVDGMPSLLKFHGIGGQGDLIGH